MVTGTDRVSTAQVGDTLVEVNNLKMYFPVNEGIIFHLDFLGKKLPK